MRGIGDEPKPVSHACWLGFMHDYVEIDTNYCLSFGWVTCCVAKSMHFIVMMLAPAAKPFIISAAWFGIGMVRNVFSHLYYKPHTRGCYDVITNEYINSIYMYKITTAIEYVEMRRDAQSEHAGLSY